MIIRVYHTGAYSRAQGENKIKFQLFSASFRDFSDKFTAYASPETGAELHRGRVYQVQFNRDPKYPMILAVLKEDRDLFDAELRLAQVKRDELISACSSTARWAVAGSNRDYR